MITIIFETDNAKLQFDQKDIKACLEILINEYGVDEAETILKCISSQTGETKQIWVNHDYFAHIALQLICAGKGHVTCEICGKIYEAAQLKSRTIGNGESPFDISHENKGGTKRLFCSKKQPALFGGKGCQCPAGHTLILVITWRT